MEPGRHVVQAYTDDAFLARAVASYIGAGLANGEGAVVLATPAHVAAFTLRLAADGRDIEAAVATDRTICLDAQRTLGEVMRDGTPDPSAFRAVVGDALGRVRRSGCATIRCFGEMVDLLWRENLDATVPLETLWNEVLADDGISLLCAYRLSAFDRAVQGVLHQVALCHSHVMPDEDPQRFDDAVRRACDDVFGADGDAATLRRLLVAHRPTAPAMSESQAALLALREVSAALAAEVLERGRRYYGRGTPAPARGMGRRSASA